MISFSCSHCGMKLKVKPEFAGRSASCPTCKQRLTVPSSSVTEAAVPSGPIDGTASSVHQAGVEGGVTLDQGKGRPGQRPVSDILARHDSKGERYVLEEEIARGGMGAVLRAIDRDIRREVAVKYLLDQANDQKKGRFVEEAQITGQLEHPNIVPIHELGVDAQKRLFFSMKMVRGRSLAQVLDELRNAPKTAEKEWPLSRLLGIFVNVCHALAYAHSRNVIHRDLKPANIMVGDFGEVYVMDWGLAKVLTSGVASAPRAGESRGADATPLASSVQTSRAGDPDLTQDGAILGTPVYMPPEQATGHVESVDQRSDVYSLGAILYELLTLQPPIDRGGTYLELLMRVAEGAIPPPEQRAPQRARQGRIPRELSAIALKALAKNPAQRYPEVEALRRDIELFAEGRSVSAKEDSRRELLWKFVKRNKGLSAGAAVTMMVLFCSTVFLFLAWLETSQANAASRKAQAEKDERTRQAVPALVQAARLLANEGDLPASLKQVELALEYEPGNLDARLLRAQIRTGQKNWTAARSELALYLQQRPNDRDTQKLADLCERGRADDSGTLLAMADVLQRQRIFGPAALLLQEVQRITKERQPLLEPYRKQINAAWPGLGIRLKLTPAGEFELDFHDVTHVTSLAPLKGLPLHRLILIGCDSLQDLSSLQGMPLSFLDLRNCTQLTNLAPLHGLSLTDLVLANTRVIDLSPLQGLPLRSLDLSNLRVHDLSPLRGMKLTLLRCRFCGVVHDLAPLQGMPLTYLDLFGCPQVDDLTPLQGMPLTSLELSCARPIDLKPLKDSPLVRLWLGPQVRDVTPLEDMKLEEIVLTPRNITRGMDGLRRMKTLRMLRVEQGGQYSPDEFWKKYDAKEFNK